MQDAGSAPATATPWSLRACEAAPVAPVWLGVAFGAVLLAVFLGYELLLGRLQQVFDPSAPPSLLEDLRLGFVGALLLAYVPTAYVYALRSMRRARQELAPVLLDDAAPPDHEWRLRGASLVGFAIGAAAPFLADPVSFDLASVSPEAVWHRITAPFMGLAIGRFGALTFVQAAQLHDLAANHVRVDLTDRGPLAPLVRHGLTASLLSMGLLSMVSLWGFDLSAAPGLATVLACTVGYCAVLAAVGFLGPVTGLHRSLRRARERELAWCADRIRSARDSLVRGSAAPDARSMADLVAYQGFVSRAPVWPFDAPALARLLLYLALPLASWIAGALVERLVDAVLAGPP